MTSPKQPLGITLVAQGSAGATGVYEDPSGIEVFETNEPYLLEDGVSLQPPLPVFDAGGPVFQDSMGNAQRALAVRGLTPPSGESWILRDGNWNDGGVWKDGETWKDS